MYAVDHARAEEFQIGRILGLLLLLDPVSDLVVLTVDPWAVRVALAVSQNQDLSTVLPAILACQPSGRFRQDEDTEEEADGRYHLQAPRHAPSGSAVDEGATVGHLDS